MASKTDVCIPVCEDRSEHGQVSIEEDIDYSQRGQWLRAAVLGATDGLVSVASLMMGIGAVKQDVRVMIITGFAGLVAGACSMAIGEFVSVYSQLDVEVAQMKRDNRTEKEALPNPCQAAVASALAFIVGAILPLLAAAFVVDHKVRLGVVVATVSLALVVFGWIGAVLGKTPVVKSSVRILVGGWIAMAVLGANDGLVSVASLIMGVGAIKHGVKAMILTGFAGLVAGACSMAIGEYVSVSSQLDVEVSQMKRNGASNKERQNGQLPNPFQAAAASAVTFTIGAMVPLVDATFIVSHEVRLAVVVAAVTAALVVFGWIGAFRGNAPGEILF
ncbi:vacuolar iron transporter homolog 4-like protein [Tanacetum coccineum]